MFRCNICEEIFDNKFSLSNHLRYHSKYDSIKNDIIDDYVNNNLTYRELCKKYNANNSILNRILKDVNVDILDKKRKRNTLSHLHSDETKIKLSEIRKKWLKENPEKHVWKRNDKFKSNPCEHLKEIFKQNDITFVEEYTPEIEIETNFKNYSIDISFPDKKVAIEVNGNQHYNSDGTLKEYYKNRHEYFIDNGWTVYEIHYSKVYNDNFINKLISGLKDEFDIGNIDYSFFIKKKEKNFCVTCGKNEVSKKGRKCIKCQSFERRKVKNRPDKKELLDLVAQFGLEGVGRNFGVSGNAVKKWLKTENIITSFDIFSMNEML